MVLDEMLVWWGNGSVERNSCSLSSSGKGLERVSDQTSKESSQHARPHPLTPYVGALWSLVLARVPPAFLSFMVCFLCLNVLYKLLITTRALTSWACLLRDKAIVTIC